MSEYCKVCAGITGYTKHTCWLADYADTVRAAAVVNDFERRDRLEGLPPPPDLSGVREALDIMNHLQGKPTDTEIIRDLTDALRAVKEFFLRLEDGCPADDPLTALRKRFHAPVHKILDGAIAKGEEALLQR